MTAWLVVLGVNILDVFRGLSQDQSRRKHWLAAVQGVTGAERLVSAPEQPQYQ